MSGQAHEKQLLQLEKKLFAMVEESRKTDLRSEISKMNPVSIKQDDAMSRASVRS
jgi:hypothetical protein